MTIKRKNKHMKNQIKLSLTLLLLAFSFSLFAQRQIEIIDRGVVAVRTSTNEVFVSWRWLGTESEDVAFYVYRDDTKLNETPITGSTNYVDSSSADALYSVAAVVDGVEQERSESVNIWSANYKDVNLQVPADGITIPFNCTDGTGTKNYPDGQQYSYSPNDCSIGDLDGDGEYEIVVKWDPSNSHDNAHCGCTGNVILDGYELDGTHLWRINLGINIRAGAHYTQYMVYDLDGDGKAEVACKTAPGSRDNSGNYLSTGPAAADDHTADYRNSAGYVLSGPEYLTVFNGETGNELATVDFEVARGSVSNWGDSYGNRVDRLMACIAYLDGENPSLVMTRGIYAKMTLAAYDWDGTSLTKRWIFDSTNSGNSAYSGQGNHQLSVADVDADGKDEIIMGACVIDDDGTGLHTTGFGHGDALHVSDMDPTRDGLEVFEPHENKVDGISYRDANSGEILWQHKDDSDVGRGLAGDIDPDHYGYEMWSTASYNVYDVKGDIIATGGRPAINFLIYWDGDLTRELLDNITISKYKVGTLLTANGCSSNNSTKATPNLSADIIGDWREELILRTTDNDKLRIYTTTDVTEHKFITLMHDPQYRLAIAWQNVGYNQPPHLGYFLGEGMPEPALAPIVQAKLKWVGSSNFQWDVNSTENWKLTNHTSTVFTDGDDVLFSMSGDNSSDIIINETVSPSKVSVVSPSDYTFSGTGKLSGTMDLVKSAKGSLFIDTDNDYTGSTIITNGTLIANGDLSGSQVSVKTKGAFAGEGAVAGVEVLNGGTLIAGSGEGSVGTTTINGALVMEEGATLEMDLSDDPEGTTNQSDIITVNGDVNLTGEVTFSLSKQNGTLSDGTYTLINYTGTFSGSLENVKVSGIKEFVYSLELSGQSIVLVNTVPRAATSVVWEGTSTNEWNLLKNTNWLNNSVNDVFVVGDEVNFTNDGNQEVIVSEEVPIGAMNVDITVPYTFAGDGFISGDGGLTKTGNGYLIMNDANTFTGDVDIQGGLVQVNTLNNIGQASSLGAGSSNSTSITLNGGGIFYAGTSSTTNRQVYVGTSGGEFYVDGDGSLALEGNITGSGVLTKRGTGTLNLDAVNSLTGAVNLTDGTIALTSENANGYGLGTNKVIIKDATLQMLNNTGTYSDIYWNMEVPSGFTGTLNLDGRCDHYGTLTGGGTLELNTPFTRSHLNGDWSAFTGQINVSTSNDGWFICGNSAGYANASVYLGDDVFAVYKNSSDAVIEIGELTGSATSVLGSGGQATNTITWQVGGKGTSVEFNGKISDDQYKNSGAKAAIIKTGTGRWTLTNASTYSGGTTISRGSIIAANTSGSATGTGAVTISSNASLAGTGSVAGEVTVNNRGYVMPGLSATIGTLTINNNLNMLTGARYYVKVNASSQTCDKVSVSGTTNLAGTLYMTATSGSFALGQSYQIINCANISGGFDAISPATPGDGLYWDTSELLSNGTISVSDAPTGIYNEKMGSVNIYPNPVKDILYIDALDINTAFQVEIHDANGKLVYKGPMVQQKNSIDVSALRTGVYFIKVIAEDTSGTMKIVKY